mgnify:CR=1 FL=1
MEGLKVYGVLQVRLARGGQDEHPILKPDVSIGRASDNDFVLESSQVSGHHLRLTISADGGISAMDLGSLNGTLLNGRPLPARLPVALQPGDTLQIDEFYFGVRQPSPQSPAPPALAERVHISPTPQPVLAIFMQGRLTKHALTKPVVEIGRTPENDIVLPSSQVSSHHARLQQSGDTWIIQDLGSTNGLTYNGRRVQQQMLRDGDVVYVSQDLALQMRACLGFVPASAAAALPSGTRAITMDMLDTITVGRAKDNTIVLDHPQVSRHHALIERLGTRHRIKDLKSANGIFVNDKRIEREAWLQEGDEIHIGSVKLRLAAGVVQQVDEGGVRIDVLRLKKWVSKSKNLLQDISLSIHPQEFVAIVGLSGAGKSTLMDAVSGFRPATHGMVLANGINLYRNFDMFRNDMGYVPQQNIVHTDLTVHKALDYAAQLRMPADTTKEERNRRIMEVLDELDLTERQDLAIHKLSGGQIKRVSIGVELLTKPRLFFLDEPTSGLDPGTEYHMMRLLRKLADQGRTIVLITHATKNVMMCDKVFIIVRGGYVAFYGPPEEALVYFDQYRTEHERRIKDIEFDDTYTVLEDERRGKPEDWDRRYRQSLAYRKYVAGRFQELRHDIAKPKTASTLAQKRPRVSTVRQFLILTRRYMDLVFRDKQLLTVLIAVMPIIGLLLLLISGRNWLVGDTAAEIERQLTADLAAGQSSATYAIVGQSQRLLFMLVLSAVLLGLFAAAYEIVKERPIYRRERMVTVRILPYLASKVVVLGAFALVQCLFLLLVVGFKVRFPAHGVWSAAMLEMYITLVGATSAAIMMGLLISALVPKTDTVIYIVFLTIFLQIIFAGVLFEMPGMAGDLSTLTLTRWGMEALGTSVNVEGLNNMTRTRFQPEPITSQVSIPISVPQAPVSSVETVTETVTRTVTIEPEPVTRLVTHTVTIEPDPMDISSAQEFQIDFTYSAEHLLRTWLILGGFGFVCGLGTIVVLKRRDVS